MSFLQLAALELTLLGALSGVVGTLIVLRRRSFFAVALSHATFPGGVIFSILGLNLLLGQALFALLLVLLMGLLSRVEQGRQVTSGVVLSFGFALGALLAGYATVPVEALLVGSPLSVTGGDVAATAGVLVAALVVTAVFLRRILFHTFDPVGFAAAGFSTGPIELVVTGLITAGVVVAMPAVGAILGVAVLIAPAAAAKVLVPKIEWIPPVAALLGVAGSLTGLWISREFDIAAGGAVGLTLAALMVLALAARWVVDLARRRGTVVRGEGGAIHAA